MADTTRHLLQTPLPLAPQASTVQPKRFQSELIANISAALQTPERTQRPPCLLRAPTGSGKTLVLGQVLQKVGQKRDVLWFWFVPFVRLVAQTLDALLHAAPGLHPVPLAQGRNQEVGAGTVLISTAQAVARAAAHPERAVVYTNLPTDASPLPYEFGLSVSNVVRDGELPISAHQAREIAPQGLLFALEVPAFSNAQAAL